MTVWTVLVRKWFTNTTQLDTRNPCVNLRFPQIFSLNKGQKEVEIIESDVT